MVGKQKVIAVLHVLSSSDCFKFNEDVQLGTCLSLSNELTTRFIIISDKLISVAKGSLGTMPELKSNGVLHKCTHEECYISIW